MKFVYTIKSAGVVLNAQIEDGLSFAVIKQAFSAISISGMIGKTYGDMVLEASVLGRLVYKAELSYIVVRQPVIASHFAAFQTALKETWTALGEELVHSMWHTKL